MDVKQKYLKYKKKYIKLKRDIREKIFRELAGTDFKKWGITGEAYKIINDIYQNLDKPDTVIDLKFIKYIREQLFGELSALKLYYEDPHVLENKIYLKFVENIADGRLADLDEIKKIAQVIHDMNSIEYRRYYAP